MSPQSDRFRVLRRLPEIKFEDELRGYSKSQVDRVLETLAPLADEVDELLARLSQAETRAASAEARLVEHGGPAPTAPTPEPEPAAPAAPAAAPADFDETLRNTLVLAQRTADTAIREANEEAQRVRSEASTEASTVLESAQEEAQSIRTQNEKDRAELEEELAAERTRLLTEARDQADERLVELEAELVEAHADQRQELINQITELEGIRAMLADDVEKLELHMTERRNTIKAALQELDEALDDPGRLRPAMPPETAEIEPLDAGDYPPIAIEAPSVAALGAELAAESEPTSSGVMLGEVDPAGPAPDAAGPATEAFDVLRSEDVSDPWGQADTESAQPSGDATPAAESGDVDTGAAPSEASTGEVAEVSVTDVAEDATRPAWADTVPAVDEVPPAQIGGSDPFLDELRRVTDEETPEDDDALTRFLAEEGDDGKSGWFGRRR